MAAFTVIDHTELSSAASSWSVSSIPSSYDHLLLKMSLNTSGTGWFLANQTTFNNDTGLNYSGTSCYALSTAVASSRFSSQGYITAPYSTDNVANTFSSHSWWIPHYANTSNYKQVIIDDATEKNGTATNDWITLLYAALWKSTAAINRIDITAGLSKNFNQYSTFTLYGVTGA
tara:strand:- start:9 stop:530 length:522 start_codon:yes stop_codon:yes gene_type:complete